MLQAQLRNRLPRLLLIARMHGHGGAGGDPSVTLTAGRLDLGVGAVGGFFHLGALLGRGVIWQLFNAWVRHVGVCGAVGVMSICIRNDRVLRRLERQHAGGEVQNSGFRIVGMHDQGSIQYRTVTYLSCGVIVSLMHNRGSLYASISYKLLVTCNLADSR